MPKLAVAAALSALLLAGCGGGDETSARNGGAAGPEAGVPANAASSEPAEPGAPDSGLADPVPPPDAVSHPDGYLPPAPGEAGPATGNSADSDVSGPATEDEYIRNGQ